MKTTIKNIIKLWWHCLVSDDIMCEALINKYTCECLCGYEEDD